MGHIVIGNNFNIISRNIRSQLQTGPEGFISIGDDVFINFGTSITAQKLIRIGNKVAIGNYCIISDSDLYSNYKLVSEAKEDEIVIEDEVWLASGVTVMRGAVIGRGSVIAAGSVVCGYIPPHTVAGGIPARVIKKLKNQDDKPIHSLRLSRFGNVPEPLVNQIKMVFSKVMSYDGYTHFDDNPFSIHKWNGLNHIRLIDELEGRFGIRIPDKEIIKLDTFGKICAFVYKQMVTSEQNFPTFHALGEAPYKNYSDHIKM